MKNQKPNSDTAKNAEPKNGKAAVTNGAKAEPKIIDVFICKRRRKLVENGAEGLSADTVWGQGYILREARDYQVLEKAG